MSARWLKPRASGIGYALDGAASGNGANLTGLAADAARAAGERTGLSVFAAFLPLAAVGVVAWRLAGREAGPR